MAKFTNVGIFGNYSIGDVNAVAREITDMLKKINIDYQLYTSPAADMETTLGVDDEDLDLVIVIGGDGTFINVARMCAKCTAPVFGVNIGRRGFLTDVDVREINESLNEVLRGNFSIETRILLESNLSSKTSNDTTNSCAMNDIVVQKTNYGRLLEFEINIDSEFVTSLRADGVIFATPTGATAYAFSAGGPVLYPTLMAIEIIPICPQTLTHRPIVVPNSSIVNIKLISAMPGHANLVVDGHVREELQGDENIVISCSKFTVDFVRIEGHSFYNALRQKLGWGI